jgi:hypothetical protein
VDSNIRELQRRQCLVYLGIFLIPGCIRTRNPLDRALSALRKKMPSSSAIPTHVYEARPRKDHRGVDRISDALPFGRLGYGEPNAISNAVDYAKFFTRSHDAVIRVYDLAGNVIGTHEHTGDFKES